MTGVAYATSAEMAKERGPFARFLENREAMLRVVRNHHRAALGAHAGLKTCQSRRPPWISHPARTRRCARPPSGLGSSALRQGELYGYRNAQVTVIAPTGTIGLVMDCDTTGIEPDFALVKFKKLAGGGYLKIVNRAVPEALRTLGYRTSEIAEMEAYAVGHASLSNAPAINTGSLRAKGFTDEKLAVVEKALAGAFDIKFVFNKWTLGADFLAGALKFPPKWWRIRISICCRSLASRARKWMRPTCISAAR